MVQYYGITREECGGNLLFVLKLDECQMLKGQHLKIANSTLMSRNIQGKDIGPQRGYKQIDDIPSQ